MKLSVGLLLAGCSMLMGAAVMSQSGDSPSGSAKHEQSTQHYMTAKIQQGRLDRTIHAIGTLRAEQTVDVSSQLSGQILRLHADFNDQVKAGQPLAELDQRTFQARVQQAEAELAVAQHEIELLQHRLNHARDQQQEARVQRKVFQAQVDRSASLFRVAKRQNMKYQRLVKTGSVSAFEADDVVARYETAAADLRESRARSETHEYAMAARDTARLEAESELAAARAALPLREATLTLAKLDLERSVIRSPIHGILIARNIEPGQTVAASLDAPILFQIANDLDQIEIHAQIDETDIGFIEVGQSAEFSVDAYSGQRFKATVREIRKSPRVEQGVVLYTVVLAVENPNKKLLPGMTATLKIVIESVQASRIVPLSAIAFQPAGTSQVEARADDMSPSATRIWVLDADNTLRARTVQLGIDDGQSVAIRDGTLRLNDRVIVGWPDQANRNWFGLSF